MAEWKRYERGKKPYVQHTIRLSHGEDQELTALAVRKFGVKKGIMQQAIYEAIAEWVKKKGRK